MTVSLVSTLLLASSYAGAQTTGPKAAAPTQAPSDPAPAPASETKLAPSAQAPAPAEAEPADGVRFRFGINPTVGLENVSAGGTSVSGIMYGADLRLGVQINNLLAVYAQPHLSFGSLGTGGTISGFTGTFIGSVMAEATFIDRLFVGAGVGYGVLNNPSGLTVEGRFGGYPLMGKSDKGPRRKGLMVGGDIRAVFVDSATGTMFMGCIGYEAF